jgi:recombinational DNA repair protein RecR
MAKENYHLGTSTIRNSVASHPVLGKCSSRQSMKRSAVLSSVEAFVSDLRPCFRLRSLSSRSIAARCVVCDAHQRDNNILCTLQALFRIDWRGAENLTMHHCLTGPLSNFSARSAKLVSMSIPLRILSIVSLRACLFIVNLTLSRKKYRFGGLRDGDAGRLACIIE